ncbi:MAG: cyclic nucleotide-binding domain-containing protein [Candidatus Latescibacteria bacterium]|nr:cyclic nucleotide-binding domain-containing protein [Candidatus Latescibacterota bacterium]
MEFLKTITRDQTINDIELLTDKERWAAIQDFKQKINFFKKINVLRGLTNKQYIKLCNISFEKTIPSHEIIYKQGDKSNTLYILKEGHIKIYSNNAHITDLSAINFFGEIGFLSGAPRMISAITSTNCKIFEINRTNIFTLFKHDDVFMNNIILNILNELSKLPPKYPGVLNI